MRGRLQAEREGWAEERSPVAVAQAGRTPDPSRVPGVRHGADVAFTGAVMGTLRLSKRESTTNRNKNGWCNENHSGLDPGLFPCGSLVFPRIQQSSPKSYLLAATALHLRGPHSSLPLLISCPSLLSL